MSGLGNIYIILLFPTLDVFVTTQSVNSEGAFHKRHLQETFCYTCSYVYNGRWVEGKSQSQSLYQPYAHSPARKVGYQGKHCPQIQVFL